MALGVMEPTLVDLVEVTELEKEIKLKYTYK